MEGCQEAAPSLASGTFRVPGFKEIKNHSFKSGYFLQQNEKSSQLISFNYIIKQN